MLLCMTLLLTHYFICRRERLEHCDAALCPSVAYQLAGAKKVQQDLARPEVLERFLDNAQEVDLIKSCFAGELDHCSAESANMAALTVAKVCSLETSMHSAFFCITHNT